ncbi:MAG TPA: response regulator [Candidatus Dormibacteraeota bacterium]
MIRTLIVDDDFRVADLHQAYVERLDGFAVAGKVHTGAEALIAVDQLRPDLVLLDVYLPDMSGIEVLQRLRDGGHPDVDVLAITAARDVDTLRSAMRGGVVHYLVKPFRFAALEEKLRAYESARSRIARLREADQVEVDRIFGTLRTSRTEPLPKGLSEATLVVVLDALASARAGLPAAEVAALAGLSRVTARRYLDHLCRIGRAEVTMRYGAPGRPEHRYRLIARELAAGGPLRDGRGRRRGDG